MKDTDYSIKLSLVPIPTKGIPPTLKWHLAPGSIHGGLSSVSQRQQEELPQLVPEPDLKGTCLCLVGELLTFHFMVSALLFYLIYLFRSRPSWALSEYSCLSTGIFTSSV